MVVEVSIEGVVEVVVGSGTCAGIGELVGSVLQGVDGVDGM